jgi:DNA-binding NtrC family response regulator
VRIVNGYVLVVDDEPLIRESLRRVFQAEGFEVSIAASLAEAYARLEEGAPEVVVLDLMLSGEDGLALLERVRRDIPETKVLIMTAYGTVESAVAAMKLGAYDFIKKPFDLDEIVAAVKNAVHTTSLERRVDYLSQRSRLEQQPFLSFDRRSGALLAEIDVIAVNAVPVVLVIGESGTGKQLVARRLHERGDRAAGPFVELNCCAVPEALFESELFGHERGAFSGAHERKLGLAEVADGGTLFLDEIGDLGLAAKRPADVAPLAAHFLADYAREYGRHWRGISPDAAALLERYAWPGNVRELRSVIARAALMNDATTLEVEHLPDDVTATAPTEPLDLAEPAQVATDPPISSLAEVELAHIRRTLDLLGGNRTLAAQRLGISRQTLAKKLSG